MLANETAQENYAICAIDKGRLLPGTMIALEPFGKDECFGSICQSKDSEVISSEFDSDKKLEYTATRFSVAMIRKYNAQQIIVFEVMLKKFRRKRA